MDKALEQYQRALTIQEVDAPNSLTVANSYNNIGCVYREKGDSDKALEQYQRALTIQEVDVPNSLTVAISYNNIGLVYYDKGDLDKALEHYQHALTFERDAPNSLTVATTYINIGLVYADKGDLDKALGHHQRALTIRHRDRDAPHVLETAAIGRFFSFMASRESKSMNMSSATHTQRTSPQHMSISPVSQ